MRAANDDGTKTINSSKQDINFGPNNFYDELIAQIAKCCNLSYDVALKEELKEIKTGILENNNQDKLRSLINYFDTKGLNRNKERDGLLELILFSLRYNIELIFSNDYKYLNLVFLELISRKGKKIKMIEVNDFLTATIENSKLDLKCISNKLREIWKILYFSIAKTSVHVQKTPPTSVIEMKSERIYDNRIDSKYPLEKEMILNNGYDIDGLVTPIPKELIATAINGDFKLELNFPRNFKTKSLKSLDYHFFYGNDMIPLGKCINLYIGCFLLPGIGELKVYLMFPRLVREEDRRSETIWEAMTKLKRELKENDEEKKTHTAMRIKINEALKTAEGLISADLVPYFFEYLNSQITANTTFFYFAEILGNKQNTVSHSFKKPISNINLYIKMDILRGLRLDICEETWVNSYNALSASPHFLADMGVKSNYNILMGKSLNNVHFNHVIYKKIKKENNYINESKYENEEESEESVHSIEELEEQIEIPEGHILINARGFIEKTNFYSRYEDILKNIRKDKFYPELTLKKYNTMKNSASAISQRKIKKYHSDLENMVRDLDDKTHVSFRKEVRIAPIFYMDALSIIHSDDTSDYLAVKTSKVNKVIKDVIAAYLEALVKEYTPFLIINLLLFEYFFQHIFLKGTQNWHYIKERLKKYLKTYRDKEIDFTEDPETNPTISFDVSEIDCDKKYVTEIIVKLYYSYQMNLGTDHKFFFEIFKTESIREGLQLIIKTMLKEIPVHLKCPDIKLGPDYDKALLLKGKNINFFTLYKNIFKSDEPYQKKMDYKIMYAIFKDWRTFKSEDIQRELKELNIVVFPEKTRENGKPIVKLHIIDYEGGNNPTKELDEKIKISTDLLDKCLSNYIKVHPAEVPEEEICRTMWYEAYKALTRISWEKLSSNFFLGTKYTRPFKTCSEIKKRFNENKHYTLSYVQKMVIKALFYNPFETPIDEIFKRIEQWNGRNGALYVCSKSFKTEYYKLYSYDRIYFELPSPDDILSQLNKEFKTDIKREDIKSLIRRYKLEGLKDIFTCYEEYKENFKLINQEEVAKKIFNVVISTDEEKKGTQTDNAASIDKEGNNFNEDFETKKYDNGTNFSPGCSTEERYDSTDGPDLENYDCSEWIPPFSNLNDSMSNIESSLLPDICGKSILLDTTSIIDYSKVFNFEEEWHSKSFLEKFALLFKDSEKEKDYNSEQIFHIPESYTEDATPIPNIMNGKNMLKNDERNVYQVFEDIYLTFNDVQVEVVKKVRTNDDDNNKEKASDTSSFKKITITMNGKRLDISVFKFLSVRVDVHDFALRLESLIMSGENSIINQGSLRTLLFSKKTRPKLPVWHKFLSILSKKKIIQRTKKGRGYLISMF